MRLNSDKIISDSKGADFLCQNGLLVGAEKLTVSLLSTERSPFLSEIKMKKEYRKRYYKNYPWAKTLCRILTRCRHSLYCKGIKNFLTTKDLKFLWFRDEAFNLKRPSIDRKDSKGYYTLGNCRYIELGENIARACRERIFNSPIKSKIGMVKKCSKCLQIKSIKEFYLRQDREICRPWCKKCYLEYNKQRGYWEKSLKKRGVK